MRGARCHAANRSQLPAAEQLAVEFSRLAMRLYQLLTLLTQLALQERPFQEYAPCFRDKEDIFIIHNRRVSRLYQHSSALSVAKNNRHIIESVCNERAKSNFFIELAE